MHINISLSTLFSNPESIFRIMARRQALKPKVPGTIMILNIFMLSVLIQYFIIRSFSVEIRLYRQKISRTFKTE